MEHILSLSYLFRVCAVVCILGKANLEAYQNIG